MRLRTLRSVALVAAMAAAACSGSSAPPGASSPTPATTAPATFVPRSQADHIEYPAQPKDVPWPTKAWSTGPLPAGVDPAAVDAILDRAFGPLSSTPNNTTDAVLVVQGGRIVAERYRPGWGDQNKVHQSWSMAKSFTQALVGILVAEGKLDIYKPAPVPQWSDPNDPRHAITTDQLLRMESGLSWNEGEFSPDSDTLKMLFGSGKKDMAAFAADKPPAIPPDTQWRYSTGNFNIISAIIGGIVGRGAAYHRFVDDRLLEPVGIDPARAKPGWDGSGQLVGGSILDLTARDFARLGLLYLRGGTWDGTQIVPQGWVDYARTPTPPPAGTPDYGSGWWTYEDCQSGFRAGGFYGQHIVLCPTLDLVVVVLSSRIDGHDGQVRDDLVHLFRDSMVASSKPRS